MFVQKFTSLLHSVFTYVSYHLDMLMPMLKQCYYIALTTITKFVETLNTLHTVLCIRVIYTIYCQLPLHMMFRAVFWVVLPSKMIVGKHFTRQYNPEDSSEYHTRRRENLKSHIPLHTFYELIAHTRFGPNWAIFSEYIRLNHVRLIGSC
jgi:hypothetical protein